MAVPEEEGRAKDGKSKAMMPNKLGTLKEFLDNM
jgi:hypothetical protein